MPTSCKGNRPLTSGTQNREIGAQTLKDVRQIKDMSYQTKHISRQARDTADQTKRMTSKLQSDVQKKNDAVACQTQATVLNIESQLKKLIKASRAPSPGRQFADWVPPLVRTLLLNGESVDKRQLPNRYTALQNVCSDPDQSDNKIALVSFLLDEGADPKLTTKGAQSTFLHLAAYNNNMKALKAIKRSWYRRTTDLLMQDTRRSSYKASCIHQGTRGDYTTPSTFNLDEYGVNRAAL